MKNRSIANVFVTVIQRFVNNHPEFREELEQLKKEEFAKR